MLDNSAESKTQATAEAERYIAWPGQALAYKICALNIKSLRAKAEKALGSKFDVREFHADVMKDGEVPLQPLAGKIDRTHAEEEKGQSRNKQRRRRHTGANIRTRRPNT